VTFPAANARLVNDVSSGERF